MEIETQISRHGLEAECSEQEALDAISSHIVILDDSGAIVLVNAAWREFAEEIGFDHADSGVGLQYLTFCNQSDMYYPTHALQVAQGISDVISGKLDNFVFEYPCNIFKDQYWYLLSASRYSSHGETRILVAHQDITELKLAQIEQAECRQEIDTILDHISSGVFTVTAAGAIESCNAAGERIFGYRQDELHGMKVMDLAGYPGCNGSGLRKANGGHGIRMRGKRQDGSEFPMYVHVRQVEVEDRQWYTIIVQDLSELKRLEIERLEKERMSLALQKESELREMKNRFLAMMSHELRTPLASIRLSHDMLANYYDQASTDERRLYLDNIKVQVEHLSDILGDVIYLTAPEDHEQLFNPERGDLITFCRDVVESFQINHFQAHDIRFDCSDVEIYAIFDKRLLRRAFSNLLDNAIKYSPDGGPVDLSLERGYKIARICVSDRGIGVPAGDADKLFDAFRRASNVGRLPGTGLGLAIAKQAIERHGGRIYLRQTNEVGATFCVELPLDSVDFSYFR